MKIYGDVLAAVNFAAVRADTGDKAGKSGKVHIWSTGSRCRVYYLCAYSFGSSAAFISVGSFGTVGRGSFSSTESQTAAAGHRGVLFGEYRFCWCDNVAHLAAAWIGLLYR